MKTCYKCQYPVEGEPNYCSKCGAKQYWKYDFEAFFVVWDSLASENRLSRLADLHQHVMYPLHVFGDKLLRNRYLGLFFSGGYNARRAERCFWDGEKIIDETKDEVVLGILKGDNDVYEKACKITDYYDENMKTVYPDDLVEQQTVIGIWNLRWAMNGIVFHYTKDENYKRYADKLGMAEKMMEEVGGRNVAYGYYFKLAEELIEKEWRKRSQGTTP